MERHLRLNKLSFTPVVVTNRPKEAIGWGLKDLTILNKALVSKSICNLISKDNMWKRVLIQKYTASLSIID